MMKTIEHIYFFHGKGGSPDGSSKQLQAVLEPLVRSIVSAEPRFTRIRLPHSDYNLPAERSMEFLPTADIAQNAVVIGISLGGLVAAKFQETSRPDLTVICVSSPTWADAVKLEKKPANRLSLYSSLDEVIADRIADWPALADAHDLPWLSHDTDRHKEGIARLITAYLSGRNVEVEAAKLGESGTHR